VTDAKQFLNEILDYFQDRDRKPGGDWAFPDDFSSLGLDYRDRHETTFWLDIERDGTIRIVWKPLGGDLKSMTFVEGPSSPPRT
jgi:hypothetical protein